MKTIHGDLVLKKDTTFKDDLKVEGNIRCEGGSWNITARDINAGDINAGGINARNIDAGDINAGGINARDIIAGDITAGDINAVDINARDITAWDINARDINARDISARDISYYAFCVAYGNITCSSIKGRRAKSFHKAIDGRVKIKKKEGREK